MKARVKFYRKLSRWNLFCQFMAKLLMRWSKMFWDGEKDYIIYVEPNEKKQ